MNDEDPISRRHRIVAERAAPTGQYTAKDFQLEILSKLTDTQELAESLRESWDELKSSREQRLLKFDTRTLIALSAIALSITGYVLQETRNTARQDAEIESTKSRVVHLEQIAATNTEGRIRTEVELQELREGQAEIKRMIAAHDNKTAEGSVSRAHSGKSSPGATAGDGEIR